MSLCDLSPFILCIHYLGPKVSSLREVIFWVQECTFFFPYKLLVIASLLYTISAYENFHKNAILLYSWGEPVFGSRLGDGRGMREVVRNGLLTC